MTSVKTRKENKQIRVLVTGATGYIGGRLVPKLIAKGYNVRVMVRHSPERLEAREWVDQVEIARGDILKPDTIPDALVNIDVAYYFETRNFRGQTRRDHPCKEFLKMRCLPA